MAVDAVVIPNGIPERLFRPVDRRRVGRLREAFGGSGLFFKMARWEREKGWEPALDAMVALRGSSQRVTLVARSGGPARGGVGLASAAAGRGLTTAEQLRRAARWTARRYVWPQVSSLLLARVRAQARDQGLEC